MSRHKTRLRNGVPASKWVIGNGGAIGGISNRGIPRYYGTTPLELVTTETITDSFQNLLYFSLACSNDDSVYLDGYNDDIEAVFTRKISAKTGEIIWQEYSQILVNTPYGPQPLSVYWSRTVIHENEIFSYYWDGDNLTIIKRHANGTLISSIVYDTFSVSYLGAADMQIDNNYLYILMSRSNYPNDNFIIVKLNHDLSLYSATEYPGTAWISADYVWATLMLDNLSNIYIFSYDGNGGRLLKIMSDGSVSFSIRTSNINYTITSAVYNTFDGYIYAFGHDEGFNDDYITKPVLQKISTSGNISWTKKFSLSVPDEKFSGGEIDGDTIWVQGSIDNKGNIIMAINGWIDTFDENAYYSPVVPPVDFMRGMFLYKFSQDGELLSNCFVGTDPDYADTENIFSPALVAADLAYYKDDYVFGIFDQDIGFSIAPRAARVYKISLNKNAIDAYTLTDILTAPSYGYDGITEEDIIFVHSGKWVSDNVSLSTASVAYSSPNSISMSSSSASYVSGYPEPSNTNYKITTAQPLYLTSPIWPEYPM